MFGLRRPEPSDDPSSSTPLPSHPRSATSHRWDDDLAAHVAAGAEDPPTWRHYCDALHRDLLRRWAPRRPVTRSLKTDLFDEAAGPGLFEPLSAISDEFVGIDLSTTAATGARRHGVRHVVRGDVRRLPFADASFDLVVSNSTLDHLPDVESIADSLRELWRVTSPGGVAIVTLDNPRCPVVALRAKLPERLLRLTGLISYEIGSTLSLPSLARAAENAGFVVKDRTTFMHVLRVTAMRSANRSRQPDRWVERRLRKERRGSLATAQLTGHFVAVRAVRPDHRK